MSRKIESIRLSRRHMINGSGSECAVETEENTQRSDNVTLMCQKNGGRENHLF